MTEPRDIFEAFLVWYGGRQRTLQVKDHASELPEGVVARQEVSE